MSSKTRKIKKFLPFLIIGIALTVALRTAACLTDFDLNSHYFNGKTLINIANYTTAIITLVCLTYPVFAERGRRYIASFSTPATYAPAGICAVAATFMGFNLLNTPMPYKGEFNASITGPLQIVLGVLAILSVSYFVLNAFITSAPSVARGAAGCIATAFTAAYAAYLYFDTNLPLNAPNKIVDQLAFLSCALFLLYETRISLGRGKWRLYPAFGLVGALLCSYSAVPSLILYFVKGQLISRSIYENIFILAMGIFILCRLILLCHVKEDRESSFVTAAKEAISERQAVIDEIEMTRKQTYLEFLGVISAANDDFYDEAPSEEFENASEQDNEFSEDLSESSTEEADEEDFYDEGEDE